MTTTNQDSSPLKSLLALDAAQAKKALDQPTFNRQDFGRLHEMASLALERLGAVCEIPETNRLRHCEKIFADLLALADDPEAQVVRPREGEVYNAGLETGQLAQLTEALAKPGTKAATYWGPRILKAIDAKADPQTLQDRRFRLQFIAMCAQAGVRIEPSESELDGEADLSKWRIGLACKRIEAENLIEAAVSSTAGRLQRAMKPGLIVLEVSGLVWPERRILAVDSDLTAAREIHRRTDAFLIEQTEAIARMVDPSFAFGVLAAATIPTLNVSSKHVAFSSSFRIASLVGDTDPRYGRLVSFARKFEALS